MHDTRLPITTRTLTRLLLASPTFARFRTRYASEMEAPSLPEYLQRLCRERGEKHESVIRRANLDRVYGHQLFSGLRRPTRDKVIQLAFGFGMCAEEAQALLRVARQSALYPRLERDAALLFCLERKMSVVQAQIMLYELGLAPLGKETGHAR